ncbi:MAG TPA: prolipoprotein diacylglyceryl transferase, partial [Deltaproteobacteria bacterium]|nr:prolipoprotein diacylglyceryl transferase [Deltaproteobacteria bacterium]
MEYPLIDPVIVRIGPLQLRWYGLMYIVGFAVAYFVILHTTRKKKLPMSRT